jgi:hypothetical protein
MEFWSKHIIWSDRRPLVYSTLKDDINFELKLLLMVEEQQWLSQY